jgi:WD40 repeat protein/tRNA A-37 threonylcarbamoyl transferase component Bud32
MAISDEPTGSHHSPLDAVIADYVQQVETGAVPDREALLAQHPDLADGLREFFADYDRLDCQAAELHLSKDATEQTGGLPHVRYFGEYELLEVIARGGMGVVYKARQASLNRIVALKMILRGQLAMPRDVARFRAEAEAAANLDHPHIVPIYEVGEHQGHQYYAMRFIEGTSLARRPRGNIQDEVRLLATVARAVHYAHQHGILHRDIKPSNILLAGDVPVITDFGLAKRLNRSSDLTSTGETPGTPRYMAPEQAAGRKDLTIAVDVYSLGVVLYERLTGVPPFTGDDVLELLRQHREVEPPRPSLRCPGLDRDLETICLKCLEKEPAKRYASAEALAEDLERWLKGEPIQARPVSTRERVVRWVRRNPVVAGLTATVVSAILVGTTFSTCLAFLARERARAAATKAREAEDNAVQAKASAQEAQERLRQSLFEQARAERATGARWRALELLGEAARMKNGPELRQEAIQAATSLGLRIVCQLGPRNLHIGGDGPFVKFRPDGSMIATAESLHEGEGAQRRSFDGIRVWQVPSGRLLGQAECSYYSGGFVFSPAAPLLALVTKGKVRLWEPKTDRELFSFPGRDPVRFSPDGALLAASGKDGVILWNVRKKQPVPFTAHGVPVAFLSEEALLVRDTKRLHVWNVRTGRETFASPEGWSPIWSWNSGPVARDGFLVALRRGEANQASEVAVWDVRSGQKLAEGSQVGRCYYAASLPLSAAADWLAFQDPSDPQTIQLVDLTPAKQRRRLVTPSQFGNALEFGRFNATGTILAAQESRGTLRSIRLWDVETGSSLATLHEHDNPVWSPDGRYLAAFGPGRFTSPEGVTTWGNRYAIVVYEVAPGAPTYRVPSPIKGLTFGPDGRRLAAQEGTWNVVEHFGRHLRLASVIPIGNEFVASGGRLWAVKQHSEIPPSGPVKLREVFPDEREIVLAGVERAEAGRIQNLAVSPDGKSLLLDWQRHVREKNPQCYHTEGRLEFWDLTLPNRLGVWEQSQPGSSMDWQLLRFSPDGKKAVTQGRSIWIWDVPTGKKLREVSIQTEIGPSHSYLHSVKDAAFNATGELLFAVSDKGRLDKIDVQTGKILTTWKMPEEESASLAFHPDGNMIATGGTSHLIRLWDTATGRELAHWEGHDTSITALTFSPDGRTLVSGSADGTLKLWDLPAIRHELAVLGLDW